MAISITQRPHIYCFSKNPVQYTFDVPDFAAAGAFLNIRIYTRVVSAAAGTETLLYDDKIKPPAAAVEYNLQDILDSALIYQLPNFSGTQIQTDLTHVKEYFITYRFITDADPDPAFFTDADKFRYIVKGGIANPLWDWNNYFINHLQVIKPFLTWQPNNRFVGLMDEFFITWLNQTATEPLSLNAFVEYTDGTSNGVQIPFGDSGEKQLYNIMAGAEALGLNALEPTKKIYRYILQVEETNNPGNKHTETYNYYIDYRQFYYTKFFHYYNSLGGLECVRIRGEIQSDINITFSESEKYQGGVIIGTPNTEQYIQSAISKTDSFKAEVGYLHTAAEKDVLQELLLGKFKWERIYSRNMRIYVTTRNAPMANTSERLHSLAIEWRYTFTNTVYTPQSADLGVGVDQENYGGGGGGGGGATCTPPSNIFFNAITDTQFTASWSQQNPVPADGFDWELFEDQSGSWVSVQTGNTANPQITLTGLTAATNYRLDILAVCNRAGGDLSTTITAQTTTAAPGTVYAGPIVAVGPMAGNGGASKNGNVITINAVLQGNALDEPIARATNPLTWPSHPIPSTTATIYNSANAVIGTCQLNYSANGYINLVGALFMSNGDYINVQFVQ